MRKTQLILALAAIGFAGSAFATNGMNLEGYGPIATGMGGASQAYDNGTAAVMNNPATLALAPDGSRLDLAVGMLGPKVKFSSVGGSPTSDGDAYYMPAVGWTKKQNNLTYGVAMFAQGGMGTEWAVGNDNLPERSELGVGRLIFPLAYNVNPDLTIGGSLDYVWAMLDIRMAVDGTQLGAPGPTSLITAGTGTLGGAATGGVFGGLDYMRLDFSDNSDFTGKAKGAGWAGKIGVTYKVAPTVVVGASYHSKTALGDLKTGANGTSLRIDNTSGGVPPPPAGLPAAVLTESGKITVHDFQWPETYGIGVSFQATPSLMVAADVKHIGWKDVMKNFKMTYATGGALGFTGTVDFSLPQNWDDQTVFHLGMSYKYNDQLTLRAGANVSENPIPDMYLHYLFPAIVENHYTVGVGYDFDKLNAVNFSLQYAPEVKQTSPMGFTMSHSQTSWQLMYSKRF